MQSTTTRLYAEPDAIACIMSKVFRDWGSYGYTITGLESPVGGKAALAEVSHADGSVFYVGATRYGNTVHAEDRDEAIALLLVKVTEDNQP